MLNGNHTVSENDCYKLNHRVTENTENGSTGTVTSNLRDGIRWELPLHLTAKTELCSRCDFATLYVR